MREDLYSSKRKIGSLGQSISGIWPLSVSTLQDSDRFLCLAFVSIVVNPLRSFPSFQPIANPFAPALLALPFSLEQTFCYLKTEQ